MKRLLGFTALVAVVVGAALARLHWFPDPSPRVSFYFTGTMFAAVAVAAGLLSWSAHHSLRERARGAAWLRRLLDNRRQTYRIRYPAGEEPRLALEPAGDEVPAVALRVLDLSEEGMRLLAPEPLLRPGEALHGRLLFPGGESIEVRGEVVRRDADQVSLRLRRPVPAGRITAEQYRLQAYLRAQRAAGERS